MLSADEEAKVRGSGSGPAGQSAADARRVEDAVAAAQAAAEAAAQASSRAEEGQPYEVEGSLPDHQPVIGPGTKQPQLLHAFGFCGAGFQTGPAVGEALAQWVHLGRAEVPLAPFSIERFHPAPALAPASTAH